MKYYVEVPCDNITIISKKIYEFLSTTTNLLDGNKQGWHFIDCTNTLLHVPELNDYFRCNKLLPRHAAITLVYDNNTLPPHIDEPPVIAKINFPVKNTQGWANCWYVENKLVSELLDLPYPIVFNSQITHSVERRLPSANTPRIVASFTFHNEPLHLLK